MAVFNYQGKVVSVEVGDVFKSRSTGRKYEIQYFDVDSLRVPRFFVKVFENGKEGYRLSTLIVSDLANCDKCDNNILHEKEIDKVVREAIINYALDTGNKELFDQQFS